MADMDVSHYEMMNFAEQAAKATHTLYAAYQRAQIGEKRDTLSSSVNGFPNDDTEINAIAEKGLRSQLYLIELLEEM